MSEVFLKIVNMSISASWLVLAVLVAVATVAKRLRKKPLSPILLILLSAGLGVLVYSI